MIQHLLLLMLLLLMMMMLLLLVLVSVEGAHVGQRFEIGRID